MSYKRKLHLETQTFDKSKPDRVELLLQVLAKHKIWNIGKRKFTSVKSEELFDKVLYSFYISWIVKNFKFPFQGNFCFVALDRRRTLMVLPPINKMSAYINSSEKGLEIYKDDFFSGLHFDNSKCPICLIKHYTQLNAIQLLHVGHLSKEIAFLNTPHKQCKDSSK